MYRGKEWRPYRRIPKSEAVPKPEISRFTFAMFDVLGVSRWVENTSLQTILDSYHSLIENAVTEGALLAVTGPPNYAYFSDTILLWCPLAPPLVDDFVGRCSDVICEALSMDIPLRGALTLGDAVLDSNSKFFVGRPIVEAAKLEKGQNWVALQLLVSGCSTMHRRYVAYRLN